MQTKRHLRDIRSDTNLAKLASLATHTQDFQVPKTISALMHRHRYNDRTWTTSKNRRNCYSLLTKNNMDDLSVLAKRVLPNDILSPLQCANMQHWANMPSLHCWVCNCNLISANWANSRVQVEPCQQTRPSVNYAKDCLNQLFLISGLVWKLG